MNDPFRPTWLRALFAAILGGMAFLLPQEAPLQYYPLNEPGDDILYLVLTAAADSEGEVQLFYDTTHGFNELDSIRIPISATELAYTYTFPLPDAPLVALRLDPGANGGTLRIEELRIIDRRETEIRRFLPADFTDRSEIAAVDPVIGGWSVTSTPDAADPMMLASFSASIRAIGADGRNFLRDFLSTGYLALMLWILLLAGFFIFWRERAWRPVAIRTAFLAYLALVFSLVGNRRLIRESVAYAQFSPPSSSSEVYLEVDLDSPKPDMAQLFWDFGNGPSEANSVQAPYGESPGTQFLRFPLPDAPLAQLRFDPLYQPGTLSIRALRVTDGDKVTRAVLPLDSLKSVQQIDEAVVADNILRVTTPTEASDPIMVFSASAVAQINAAIAAARE